MFVVSDCERCLLLVFCRVALALWRCRVFLRPASGVSVGGDGGAVVDFNHSVRTKPLQVMLDTPLCIANSNVSFVHVCWLGFLSILTQGFLLKRRETGNWQKRWCVLTERNMEYYHSRQVRSSFMVRYGKRCWGGKRGLWCGMRCVVLYRVVAWHRSTV